MSSKKEVIPLSHLLQLHFELQGKKAKEESKQFFRVSYNKLKRQEDGEKKQEYTRLRIYRDRFKDKNDVQEEFNRIIASDEKLKDIHEKVERGEYLKESVNNTRKNVGPSAAAKRAEEEEARRKAAAAAAKKAQKEEADRKAAAAAKKAEEEEARRKAAAAAAKKAQEEAKREAAAAAAKKSPVATNTVNIKDRDPELIKLIKTAFLSGGEDGAFKAYKNHLRSQGLPDEFIPNSKNDEQFKEIFKLAEKADPAKVQAAETRKELREGPLREMTKEALRDVFPNPRAVLASLDALNARIEEYYAPLGDEALMTYQAREGKKVVRDIIEGHEKCRGGGGAGGEAFCNWPVMHSEGLGMDCLVHSFLTATCPAFRRLDTNAKIQAARAFRWNVMTTIDLFDDVVQQRLSSEEMLQDPELNGLAFIYNINYLMFQSSYKGSRGVPAAHAKIRLGENNPGSPVYMLTLKTESHFESVRTPEGSYTVSLAAAKSMRDPDLKVSCPVEFGDIIEYRGKPYRILELLFPERTDGAPCNRVRLAEEDRFKAYIKISDWTIRQSTATLNEYMVKPNGIVPIGDIRKIRGAAGAAAGNAGGAGEGGGRRHVQRRTRRRRAGKGPKRRQTKRRA